MSELLIKNCTKATFFNDGYNAVNFFAKCRYSDKR